jgi:sodium-independent sulfate anion transporter 11
MYGAGSELSIVSRSTMSTWISDRHFVDEIHKKRRRVCKRWRKTCTRDLLYRRLPFLSWITKYDFSKLLSDANAGMAVSLTAIPQTIGYAAVAGLPAQVSVPRTLLLCFFLPGLFFSCSALFVVSAVNNFLHQEHLDVYRYQN